MSYLTDGDLYRMRQMAQPALPGTAVIHRPVDVADGQGGHTRSFSPVGTVACNLAPVTRRAGDEQVIGERLESASVRYLTVPALTDLTNRDRVVISGGTFEVTGLREPRPVEIVRRAVLSQIV